ncbi:DUF5361 domain-containing protein [Nocardia higoensis]|nr:DUF5361 domain-containing protein [Nocardia higoensis]
MARPFGSQPGGILGLDALLEEHGEAVEFDLIALGLRLRQLGTDVLSWRDLLAIIRWLPAESALLRSMDPVGSRWQVSQHLLAEMTDSLRWLVWAKTPDAQQGRNRPEPIARPGKKTDRERVGTATAIDQMNTFLEWGR